MSHAGPPPSLPAETYREIIDELRAEWDRFGGAETRTKEIPIARYVFALTANAYTSARAATTLWDAGLWPESTPNVRGCFESAVTAAWTQQTGEVGIEAAGYEQARQSTNLLSTAEAAGIPVPAGLRAAIQAQRTPVAPPMAVEARTFERMCRGLRGGSNLYLFYRFLSSESHAASALRRHLEPTQSGGLKHIKRPVAHDEAKASLGCAVAYSLVWAGRAFTEVMLHKPKKRALQNAARRLGIPSILVIE